MPLTLDATVGSENANSYATVTEAVAHAEYRVGGAAFIALDEEQQIQALVTATSEIDALEYEPGLVGERYTEDQALAFPRDTGDVPRRIKKATIELAMSYAPAFAAGTDPLNADVSNGNIKREKVGPLETEFFAAFTTPASAIERFPASVQRWLAEFVVTTTTGWGSASVGRGS